MPLLTAMVAHWSLQCYHWLPLLLASDGHQRSWLREHVDALNVGEDGSMLIQLARLTWTPMAPPAIRPTNRRCFLVIATLQHAYQPYQPVDHKAACWRTLVQTSLHSTLLRAVRRRSVYASIHLYARHPRLRMDPPTLPDREVVAASSLPIRHAVQ
ncbi:MAG: hypothetical protein U0528_21320 [Anaerolineae bacterium]